MTTDQLVEETAVTAGPPQTDSFQILLLDTVKHTDMIETACKSAGHTVSVAHTIETAFDFLDGPNPADLIICAAYLEDQSLFDFLKRLRKSPVHKNTMFMTLALSASEMGTRINASTEKAGIAMGSDSFINMPVFDAEALVTAIRNLLPEAPRKTCIDC